MTSKIEHPREIAVAINKNESFYKTLSVEAFLEMATESPKETADNVLQDPLKFFAEYSTFHFTIIEKQRDGQNTTFARANILPKELAMLERRTQYATEKIMDAEQSGNNESNNLESAYTQQIRVGEFKGKTPAQVLLDNSENRDKLERTCSWLKEKISAHPGNKLQYDAIKEALLLYEQGKLQNKQCTNSQVLNLLQKDYNPLRSTRRSDGKMMNYAIQIKCYPSDNMPYEITVRNFWALYNENVIVEGSATEQVTNSIRITEAVWDNIVESMRRTVRIYERCYGKYELERALRAAKENEERQKSGRRQSA